jgi:hypothetical protein
MPPLIGAKLKNVQADAWLDGLANHLYPGEEVTALARTNLMQPNCNAIAITNARVVAFHGRDVARNGVKREVAADQIERVGIPRKISGHFLIVETKTGEVLTFGALRGADFDLIHDAVGQLAASGPAPAVAAWLAARYEQERQIASAWEHLELIGESPSDQAWQLLKEHATQGDTAWFVVGARDGGAFAAFDDHCVIVKPGGPTTFPGRKINTFRYADIAGIEYKAGSVEGALEVLMAEDKNHANKDRWTPGAHSPRTSPNALPLDADTYRDALPLLNGVRERIANAQRP